MARSLKPQVLDTLVDSKKSLRVDLKLDRNTMEFFAQVSGTSPVIRAKAFDELKRKVRLEMERHQPYVWRHEIWVVAYQRHGGVRPDSAHGGMHSSSHRDPPDLDWPVVGVFFSKHEVADIPRDPLLRNQYDIVEREFCEPGQARDAERDEVYGVKPCFHPENTRVLPYTPELWAALEALQARILTARRQLFALLERDDLEATLKKLADGHGVPLLVAGPADENESESDVKMPQDDLDRSPR